MLKDEWEKKHRSELWIFKIIYWIKSGIFLTFDSLFLKNDMTDLKTSLKVDLTILILN